MAQVKWESDDSETVIELREPWLAALLAWLVPGAGHLYQGRTGKGVLFMVCILATFFYGLVLGEGKVVYASWKPEDRRLPYLCQVGAGLPALPALVEAYRAENNQQPLLGIMVPPESPQELGDWHRMLDRRFELGTVYTMVAGLLNILVIYDAFAGPMQYGPDEKKKKQESKPAVANSPPVPAPR